MWKGSKKLSMFNFKKTQLKGSIFEQVSFPSVAFTFFLGIVIVFLLYSFISKDRVVYNKHVLEKREMARESADTFFQNLSHGDALEYRRADLFTVNSEALKVIMEYSAGTFSKDFVRDNIFRSLEESRVSVFYYDKSDTLYIAYGVGVHTPFKSFRLESIPLKDIYRFIVLYLKKPQSALSWAAYPQPVVFKIGTSINARGDISEEYSSFEEDTNVSISGRLYSIPTIYYQETYFDNHGTVQYVFIGFILLLIILCGYVYQYVIIRSLVVRPLTAIAEKINSSKSPKDLSKITINVQNEIGDIARALSHVSGDLDDMYKNLRVKVDEKTSELQKAMVDLHDRLIEDDVILREMSDGLILANSDGSIVNANNRIKEITGIDHLSHIHEIMLYAINNERLSLQVLFDQFVLSEKNRAQLISYDTFYGVVNGKQALIPLFVTVSHINHDDGRRQYLLLIRDITEEISMSREKNEFVSFASHQLKTPMTNILWITEGLKNGLYGDVGKQLREPIDDIHMSSKKMVNIVNTLLQVSRLEMDVMSIRMEKINVCDIVKMSIKDIESWLHDRKITVNHSDEECCGIINTDVKLLKIVFDNLISNAVKYSHDGGHVVIRISHEPGSICVSFIDHGIGIPAQDIPELFKKMKRGSNVETTHEGNGLGLYMVKLLLAKLGGEITVESKEGSGTTMGVVLKI